MPDCLCGTVCQATAYDVNQLGDMPDLDPTSRENYRQYAKNNERVDELMDEIYSVSVVAQINEEFHHC